MKQILYKQQFKVTNNIQQNMKNHQENPIQEVQNQEIEVNLMIENILKKNQQLNLHKKNVKKNFLNY